MAALVSWVQCNRCDKWRIVDNASMLDEDAAWFCEMNPNSLYDSCAKPEEVVDEVMSPKRYISSNKSTSVAQVLVPPQPLPKRQKTMSPEQELIATLKTWPTEKLREYWETIDWGNILDLQRPHEPALAEFKDWKNVDDTDFVLALDARMRASLHPRIAAQIPKLTSLAQQEAKLRAMLADLGYAEFTL